MEKIQAIAVDDEPIALEVITSHAAKVPFLELKATFVSATEAMAYLTKMPVQVVFLDIHMPDLTGIDFAQIIGTSVKIIFTTAYEHYAVAGFELSVVDYLLKPISYKRFLQACTKAQQQGTDKIYNYQANSPEESIFVKDGYDLVRIHLPDLLYIEADDNYLIFQETARRILTRMKFSEALKKLPKNTFIRVHKSYIVSMVKIEKVERHQITVSGKKIPLSSNYKESLFQKIQ